MGVHLGVREEPELLELVGGEQMGLIDDQDDSLAPLGLLGGQGIRGLGDEGRLVKGGARHRGH
jgi:hypothetical protein